MSIGQFWHKLATERKFTIVCEDVRFKFNRVCSVHVDCGHIDVGMKWGIWTQTFLVGLSDMTILEEVVYTLAQSVSECAPKLCGHLREKLYTSLHEAISEHPYDLAYSLDDHIHRNQDYFNHIVHLEKGYCNVLRCANIAVYRTMDSSKCALHEFEKQN